MFATLNYSVKKTNQSGDYGADLFVISPDKRKIVIQAKRYKAESKVGVSAIQEVYAAKSFYKADEAWVITTSDFTSQAKSLSRKIGVKLGPRIVLSEIIHKAYGSGNFNRKKVSYKAASNPDHLKASKKTIKNFSRSTKKIKSDIKKISRTSRKTKRTFRKINKLFK